MKVDCILIVYVELYCENFNLWLVFTALQTKFDNRLEMLRDIDRIESGPPHERQSP